MNGCEKAKIVGYREQTEGQIKAINYFKQLEIDLVTVVMTFMRGDDIHKCLGLEPIVFDKRWMSIAKTHFQEGFMAAVRAIARPNGD